MLLPENPNEPHQSILNLNQTELTGGEKWKETRLSEFFFASNFVIAVGQV